MLDLSTLTEAETAAEQRVQDAQYFRSVLHEMIGIGVELGRRVLAQTASPAEDATPDARPASDCAIAYDRIFRSVRRGIALAQKVAELASAPTAATPAQDRVAARKHIIRTVGDAIHRQSSDVDAEDLYAEFSERLDSPDLEDDIGTRPIAEIIDELRRDLGVDGTIGAQFWKRRTPADIAILNAQAATARGAAPVARSAPDRPDWELLRHGPAGVRHAEGCRPEDRGRPWDPA